MKKYAFITFIAAFFCVVPGVSAQGQPGNMPSQSNEFWERRNAFIVAEMKLSANEAAKFIPLENEFKQKVLEVGRECRSLTRESMGRSKMTDAEYLKLIDCYIDNRIKEAQLEKEYYEMFKKILSPEKLHKYHEADAKFARELVNMRRTAPDRDGLNRPPDRNNQNRENDRNNTNRPGNRR